VSTTVSLPGHVLDAMLPLSAEPKSVLSHAILSHLLVEITPESLRLIATDSYVLGILHLTAQNTYGVDIACDAPRSMALPVHELQPILSDQQHPTLYLSFDGLQVTVSNASGMSLSMTGRPAAEYPDYHRIIPRHVCSNTISCFSVDAALIAKFTACARALREDPKLSFSFHAETPFISVSLNNLSAFYGLIAPYREHGSIALPPWLAPPVEPRRVHLCICDRLSGIDTSGNTWAQFTAEALADHVPGPCTICDQVITTGWLCLDNGEAVCNGHVTIPVAASVTHARAALAV